MEVRFYRFSKRINSTAQPSTAAVTLQCQLKEPTSVESPTLIINRNNYNPSLNYAYIPAWGMFYFVNNATMDTGNRANIECSIDRLATYRSSIFDFTAFVERSSIQYNDMFSDNIVSNTENIIRSASASTSIGAPFQANPGCYLLRAVNNDSSSLGLTTYILNQSQLKDVLGFLFTKANFTDVLSDAVVQSFFNPFQYIVSLRWMPVIGSTFFQIPESTKNVVIGWWDTGITSNVISKDGAITSAVSIDIPASSYSDFRRYDSSFTRYSLYLPMVGTVGLAAEDTYNGLKCTLSLDALTGEGEYHITNNNNVLISTYKTQMSVDVQIGQMSTGLYSIAQSAGDLLGSAVGKIPVIGKAAGEAVGNFATGAIGALASMNPVTSQFNQSPSVNGQAGAKYPIESYPNIICTVNCVGSGERATATVGRPLYATKKLSDLAGGYVKCGGASIAIPGYEDDASTINNFLNTGVWLE